MRLYHASNVEVKHPEIINRVPTLDFGAGFYTTSNRAQADEFALKVYLRRGSDGSPTVSVFDFDVSAPELDRLVFETPSEEWLDFVVRNRRDGRREVYDLIIGPVANDDVFATIMLYERGELTKEDAIKRFRVKKLFDQYLFCTKKALGALTFVESYTREAQ